PAAAARGIETIAGLRRAMAADTGETRETPRGPTSATPLPAESGQLLETAGGTGHPARFAGVEKKAEQGRTDQLPCQANALAQLFSDGSTRGILPHSGTIRRTMRPVAQRRLGARQRGNQGHQSLPRAGWRPRRIVRGRQQE